MPFNSLAKIVPYNILTKNSILGNGDTLKNYVKDQGNDLNYKKFLGSNFSYFKLYWQSQSDMPQRVSFYKKSISKNLKTIGIFMDSLISLYKQPLNLNLLYLKL